MELPISGSQRNVATTFLRRWNLARFWMELRVDLWQEGRNLHQVVATFLMCNILAQARSRYQYDQPTPAPRSRSRPRLAASN